MWLTQITLAREHLRNGQSVSFSTILLDGLSYDQEC